MRNTAYDVRISDWSSDVCSSVLAGAALAAHAGQVGLDWQVDARRHGGRRRQRGNRRSRPRKVCTLGLTSFTDRKSVVEGKGASVRVDLGGGCIIKNTKKHHKLHTTFTHDTVLRYNHNKYY